MELHASAVEILVFLLPGFICAEIYFALTPAPRPTPFERTVQALIFTMIIHAAMFGLRASLTWEDVLPEFISSRPSDAKLIASVVLASCLGVGFAWISNRDKLHALLRGVGITDQTSFSSEWYGAFSKNKGYVVLHLDGGRRLYGWPVEWPSTAKRGYFVMANSEWLDEDNKSIRLEGVDRILVPADEVTLVELMSIDDESVQEENNG